MTTGIDLLLVGSEDLRKELERRKMPEERKEIPRGNVINSGFHMYTPKVARFVPDEVI